MSEYIFWFCITLLFIIVVLECLPLDFNEGFTGAISVGDSTFWAKLVPRRGDVGPEQEQGGYKCDKRYFSDYVDVQRFGNKSDYCRIVQKGNDITNKFIACALGGTDNLTSVGFRGPSVKDGFRLSRDDYMRDVDGEGRASYCRILKQGEDFVALCNVADDIGFSKKESIDPSPPKDIELLLNMYQGCVFWLRLRDDMIDYIQNLHVSVNGKAGVDESVIKPPVTRGLVLNGMNQYLRIGDDSYLGLGSTILLRNMRAFSFWVKFDEFTNNAHIFDFGNGAGIDNVWVGILNKGNQGIDTTIETSPLEGISGPQPVEVTTPQDLMETTGANVEAYTSGGFTVNPKVKSNKARANCNTEFAKKSDMCYEIWDSQQRKMRIIVKNMFTVGTWTHVVITTEGTDAFRPDIVVYKDGAKVYVEPSGWLPQNNNTTKNYIGKSNWANVTSQYGNRDELFKGSLFDMRGYNNTMSPQVIKESYNWGKKMLGL